MKHDLNLAASTVALTAASAEPVRGMISVPRADAGNPAALIETLNKAFEQFKEANDRRLGEIENKLGEDPVSAETVDKINAALEQTQAELDRIAKEAAKARIGNGQKDSDRDWEQETTLFLAAQTGKPVNAVTGEQIDQYKAYASAHASLIRRGGKGGETLDRDVQAALSVGQDSDGGFLVPTEIARMIQQRQFETSDVRAVAGSMTISTDKLVIPLDVEEAASGGWVSEKGTRTETNTPGVGEQTIETWEQYAEPKATQRILDDAAINVESWLGNKIADIFERTENTAFVTGDGINKPKGILGYAADAVTTADASRAWGKLQYVVTGKAGAFDDVATGVLPADSLISLIQAAKARYRNNGRFAMNRSTVSTTRKLKDGDGNYIWQPSLVLGQPSALLGYPITEWEDMPDIASGTFSIAFGDFNAGYLVVDRIGIRTLRDPYTSKGFVKFYTTKRVGGDVVDFDAIKLLKFATS